MVSESSPGLAPSGFFVLRSPLLPFDVLRSTESESDGCGSDGSELRRLISRPDVREALFIASPSLDAELDGTESTAKVERALRRYVARMAGRATPFGLFAGCSVGHVGRATRLTVGESSDRHTRLDMDYVLALTSALAGDPRLQATLRFRPNSSLYRVDGRARYVEIRRKDQGWTHHRATIEVPDYLGAVLSLPEPGATRAELTRVLLDADPDATEEEASEYVSELIRQQVLVSELAPAVTGAEPVQGLIDRLRESAPETATCLSWVQGELMALDSGGLGAAPDRYRAIATKLAELPAEVDAARLFQVDLVRRPAGATLGENVVAEISRGVELLRRLTPRPADDPLAAFRRAFVARFGDSPVTREVPLAEALDEETGVGFADAVASVEASSLLEGLEVFPETGHRVPWGPRETHLLALLTETLARGEQELILTEQDVERLAVADPPSLPDAFAAMARLEATSDEAVARGDFRLLLAGTSGPSGARLLGRFCHADSELALAVEGHLRSEESLRPDAVFAEIVHLPEGRLGNILARPVCRSYEIPYLGRSGAPIERQLPLSDLRVSVIGERVILRSARLGREVVPRLTSAHNFGASPGVYGFLCALQGQGVAAGLGWDWGPLIGSAFLPRVTFGRLVLARSRWRISKTEAARLSTAAEKDRSGAVLRWRADRRLPRWVCLVEGDNELPVDLDNPAMFEVLLDRLRGRGDATLSELFPSPDRLCAVGKNGRYMHELVIPFVTRAPATAPAASNARSAERASGSPSRRAFPPGSDWLSVKLYAGSLVVDHLVREVVGPLANDLVGEGVARLWFFVRYADPHGHLRLRFLGDPRRLWDEVLPLVQSAVAPLLADGRVWKVQLDTYEREIERYGGRSGIEECEQLFHVDSRASVELLGLQDDDPRGDRRWRLALVGLDLLLDDLGLDLSSKVALLGNARKALRTQYHENGARLSGIGAKYRAESSMVARLLSFEAGSLSDAERAIFERQSRDAAGAATALRRSATDAELTSALPDLAGSLMHMHCNRMLRSGHRLQELVLYELLHRYYAGERARCPAACGSA